MLLRARNGKLVTHGVVSGGIGTDDLVCYKGTIYASFGPDTLAFVEAARDWKDPCGDIITRGRRAA